MKALESLLSFGAQWLRRRPLRPDPKAHAKWLHFMRDGYRVHIPDRPLIRPGSRIFCIGSCFAIEIKSVLRSLGYTVHPHENDLPRELLDQDPDRNWGRILVHYNTFTMWQEIEKAFGLWRQDDNDFWAVTRQGKGKAPVDCFQDPYRREVFARTMEEIRSRTRALDELIRKGVHESDVYIFTLGLTEVWKKKDNGRVTCGAPGLGRGGGYEQTEFLPSGYEQNYRNVRRLVDEIHARYPSRPIVLSVSPVLLAQTYTDRDVFTANMESKSILRAVAGQIARECPNTHYFPAFELCALYEKTQRRPAYGPDGRHVTRETVRYVLDSFIRHYSSKS